ncbi:decapping endonuclease targeting mRNA [Coemansia erecta]|nr:decapping endonuclease targeting mRNA [Coemansia sp. RSA 2618]KAJ2827615.1 decapping endonuclease targeting mRNA [Coemansia erecta]
MSGSDGPPVPKRRASRADTNSQPEDSKHARRDPEMRPPLARFSIHPLSKYRLACPAFKEPREILSFSYDEQRQMRMDNHQLKYFYPPRVDDAPSLFDGFEQQICRDSTKNEHIDGLLNALAFERQRARAALDEKKKKNMDADFVMYRGMLTRIFVTPFSLRDEWSMNIARVGRTIYIEDNVTSEKIAERAGSSEQHQKMMFSGYKFEALSMIDAPPESLSQEQLAAKLGQRSSEVVNTHSEYCTVFRTQLGPHSIISGAEVDCIDRAKPGELPNRHYRELKTSRCLDTEKARNSFARFKLLKFWAQSFIAGIPVVTVGFRDDEGRLREVRDIRTQDMPRMVRDKPRMWEANVCMNFANQVLQFIKDQALEEGPEAQYRIEYNPETSEIQLRSLGNRPSFLTDEYMKSLE